ncbi:MAG: S8 family serine peptidase [Planctomycetota bacterium]|jgi:hypothetical protein
MHKTFYSFWEELMIKKSLLFFGSVIFGMVIIHPAVADNWERHISGAYEVTEFDGTGEVIGVFDTGAAWNHNDFNDSGYISPYYDGQIIDYMYDGPGDNVGQGTAIAGIIAGTGQGDGSTGSIPDKNDARGIAEGAKLIIQDYDGAATPGTMTQVISDAEIGGARLHVNGWGMTTGPGGYNDPGVYALVSSELDARIRSSFYMAVFFGSGQDGTAGGSFNIPGCLYAEATAKNVITVGGFDDNGTTKPLDDNRAGGASIGPTKDNRVKPDLLGQFNYSKTTDIPGGPGSPDGGAGGYDAGDYTGLNGTRAAVAYVAAIGAVVREMYKANHFQNDPVILPEDLNPHAATLKALLIANAVQLDISSNTRFEQGWGEPSISNIYNVGANHFIIDESCELAQDESVTFKVAATGATDLKITLVWTDPAASPGANPTLVNDLDLEVSQGATVWYGNMGLDAGHYSTSGPGLNAWDTDADTDANSDNLNNVENVFIEKTGASGAYDITVRAANIAQGGNQNFALVASGISAGVGRPYWPQSNANGFINITTDVTIAVSDSDLTGDPCEPLDGTIETVPAERLRVFSDTDPCGINIALLETTADSRLFTNGITLTKTGSSDEGQKILKVSEGDTLSIEYFDQAPIQQKIYATAILDTIPPTIIFVPPTDANSAVLTDRDYTNMKVVLSEPSTAWLEWNGINESMMGGSTNWYLNKTNLAEGTYTYRVWAEDGAGNLNVSETRTITTDYAVLPSVVEHYSTEDIAESDTNSTSYQTKAELTFTPEVPGDFIIIAAADIGPGTSDSQYGARVTVDGTTHHEVYGRNNEQTASDWTSLSMVKKAYLDGTQHSIKIAFRAGDPSWIGKIRNARIFALAIASHYAEDESFTETKLGTNKITLTDTFAEGEYLIIASAVTQTVSTSCSIDTWLVIDSTGRICGSYQGLTYTESQMNWGTFSKVYLTGTHTITLNFGRSCAAPSTVRMGYAHVAAIPLGQFSANYYSAAENEVSFDSGAYNTMVANTYAPYFDDYLILGTVNWGGSSNSSLYTFGARMQLDGTSTVQETNSRPDETSLVSDRIPTFYMDIEYFLDMPKTDTIDLYRSDGTVYGKETRLISIPLTEHCPDVDGDGYTVCDQDCDCNDPSIYPGASEVCDGLDNDCDGWVDEAFTDTDGDSYADCVDNCPGILNPDQMDTDGDGIGDLCECKTANIDGQDPVNFKDFAILASDWWLSGSGLAGDVTGDEAVNFEDLGQVVQHWLSVCN